MNFTHENHYVPKWHQCGFISEGQQKYHYRDLNPPIMQLPGGGNFIQEYSEFVPKKCFKQTDLYTTLVFGKPDDSIEKFLFGEIDNKGAIAIRAMAQNDYRTLHENFQELFQYLDAQKLRTPKGLEWIKSHFHQLDQNQLISEMINLRTRHCVMWTEAVREVVSAEESSVKFILTDHPVSVFNIGCPPNHPMNLSPNEPSIALKGSQTVFPLNMNNCLILTNIEYAKNPQEVDPLTDRTNARFSGESICMTNNTIQKRKLKTEEVMKINYFLKRQASKYIAAANKNWLNPESFSWKEIAKTLLPPKNELWNYGGDMYLGYSDGAMQYADEHGRGAYIPAEFIKMMKEKELKEKKD